MLYIATEMTNGLFDTAEVFTTEEKAQAFLLRYGYRQTDIGIWKDPNHPHCTATIIRRTVDPDNS